MTESSAPSPARIAAWLFAAQGTLLALHVVNLATSRASPWVNQLVDLDLEGNLPTWFASMQLAAVGGLWLRGAWDTASAPARATAYGLAAVFLFLSLDEVAQIHENLAHWIDRLLPGGSREDSLFEGSGIWMFFLGPPLAAALAYLVLCLQRVEPTQGRPIRRLLIGCVVFVVAATVPDVLGNFIETGTLADHGRIAIEEVGEMSGVTLIVWGTLDLLGRK